MEDSKSVFQTLNSVNVNDYIEKKGNLSYLSWSCAWQEVKKRYPDATYEVVKFDGLPYIYDEKTGYICYTKVTIEGLTYEMWLPVMNYANLAMKAAPYEGKIGYKKVTVEAATMTDINKTIMRCLVKNLSVHGLGLYVFRGEGMPEEPIWDANEAERQATATKSASESQSVQHQNAATAPMSVQPKATQQPVQTATAPSSKWVSTKSFQ